jgi:hypothetical protein
MSFSELEVSSSPINKSAKQLLNLIIPQRLRGINSRGNQPSDTRASDAPISATHKGRKQSPGRFTTFSHHNLQQNELVLAQNTVRTCVNSNRIIDPTSRQVQQSQDEGPDQAQERSETPSDIESLAKTPKEQELAALLEEQNGLLVVLNTELEGVKQTLGTTELVLEQERVHHEKQMQEQNNMIDRLQVRITEATTKSTEMPGQSPLRRPESETVKEWQSLTYDVHNLVMNYFSRIKTSKMVSWARAQEHHLKELTPDYAGLAADKKLGTALVEAAIWNTLCRLVFGDSAANGAMLWAGSYFGKLSKLSMTHPLCLVVPSRGFQCISNAELGKGSELSYDMARRKCSDKQSALFHEWKALTTSLISLVCSQQDRERKILDVADELEDMLESFRSTVTVSLLKRELRSIVCKAVALDESFCGQQAWYRLMWPPAGRHDVELDRNLMKPVGEGGGKRGGAKTTLVMFVIQPCLCRAGGAPGESYDHFNILDKSRVWVY